MISIDATQHSVVVSCAHCPHWAHLTDTARGADEAARAHIWQVHPSERVESQNIRQRQSRRRIRETRRDT